MKRNTLLMTLFLGLALVGSTFAAASKHPGNAASPLKMSGTVVSSSSSELVLSSTVKGKPEQETFVVNSQTKTNGTLTTGEKVIVRYMDENGKKVATAISAPKMAATKIK
jgi:hypothetical protein